MTKLFDDAVATVRRLPPATQDQIAEAIMDLARSSDMEPEAIDPAHRADVLEGLAQARRREFASDDEIAAAFARFDP